MQPKRSTGFRRPLVTGMGRHEDRHSPSKRIRASESAIRAALKAIQDAGLPVDKVCISGGQVEIHCRSVEDAKSAENDGGLKKW